MKQVFPSEFFNFEFLRVIGATPFLSAEVGECFVAASKIKDLDPESWYHAWWNAGKEALVQAKEAENNNDKLTARWAYLRASNYFRASEFMLHCNPQDPRILAASQASVDAFDNGWVFLDGSVYKVDIPFEEGKFLPGRLYLPAIKDRLSEKVPLILQMGGFDSTQEELYTVSAAGALPRGYAVLSFDGPGQGLPLRKNGLFFREDWEIVTSQVLDFVVADLAPRHGLDLERLAVIGSSLGGYFALRAAIDPRVKACISVDGPYDLFEVTKSRMPGWFINGWLNGWLSDSFVNFVIRCLARGNFQLAWEFSHSMWVHGVELPTDVLRVMRRFTLNGPEDNVLAKVKCPTLVTGAADSFYFTPEQNANKVMEGLASLSADQKELWVCKGPEKGGLQAKIGSLAIFHQKTFSWLDRAFGIDRAAVVGAEGCATA